MKVAFYTLGCKVNHYETQAMEELFREAGHEVVSFDEQADAYIVNTCTVTQISDKKSRQVLSQAHRRNPNALIAAVGCYAEVAKESVAKLDGVSLVLGTDRRSSIVELLEQAQRERMTVDLLPPFKRYVFEELRAQHDGRTRAILKVQDGCNAFCSYCMIPFARGALRSRTIASTERELRALAENGYREVVLTGIQLSAYGADLPEKPGLSDLIELADRIPGLDRLRLGSLEPRVITDRFLETAQRSRTLCPQFHLSLQSGSDSVLRRMNRRYTTEEYRAAVRRIRDTIPNAAITTDVIAGFVGETEAEHDETKRFLQEIGFARVHVFPYSRRKGTKADEMEGHLPRAVKEARAHELIVVSAQMEAAFIDANLGKTFDVIMEDDGTGYTRNYIRVRYDGTCGETVSVKLTAREGTVAIGIKEQEENNMCLFCSIAAGEIPSKKAYEDDSVYAFHDIAPQAPVHILIIPKQHIESAHALTRADDALIGHMFEVAQTIAMEYGLDKSGYRLITNVGQDAGQSVPHLHLHLIGGKTLKWDN